MNENVVADLSIRLKEAYPSLQRYAWSLTGNKDDAHDLVMKAFMKLVEKLKNSNWSPENFQAYLKKIIRNTFIDGMRKSKFETSIDDTEGYLEPIDPELPSDPFMKRRMAVAFGELSETCQEILGLVAQGCTYDEIADTTQKTKNAVAGAIYHCRDKFRIKMFGQNQGLN